VEKVYLDTSVFGGYFESEFELWTKILFNKIANKEFIVIYSRLPDIELSSAPENVRNLAESIPYKQLEFVDITDEAIKLADEYIEESVVGKTSRADCLHIALATIHKADILAVGTLGIS